MKTLYTKFVVLTIGVIIGSFLFAFILSNMYYQLHLKEQNDAKNTEIAHEVKTFIEKHPDVSMEEYLTSISEVGYQLCVVDQAGTKTFYGAAFRETSLSPQVLERVWSGETYHGMNEFPTKTFVTGYFANELRNSIGVPVKRENNNIALFIRPNIEQLFNEMHILFGWIVGIAFFAAIIFVLISTKFLVQPISEMTNATKSLAEGNFNVQLNTKRQDELGKLATSFQHMARQLEQSDDMKKAFISNVSHDIQSPLSTIKNYLELTAQTEIKEEQSEYSAIIHSEVSRLSTLTRQLLLLASLDQHDFPAMTAQVDIAAQWKEVIRNYQWILQEKELSLDYSIPNAILQGDASMLYAVWDNVLTNAIKYTPPHGRIDITVEKTEDSVGVTVKDDGIGMTPAELERIFERFYRADSARGRNVEGTGLGLSIVQQIIELHKGTIDVTSIQKEGTTVKMTFPTVLPTST
ncbi:sensor histidine kinase [Paenisporosarcina cavernae]|uniref:Heme sensor protein HssS n=1 Tax=Paenisporosarcina cavernae TaxID=2320858 RepID=A0A385YR51_9BACL|nr:HAMP domain-containing sensor histidine kinase [Paenisporosarcina cavernae]AYC28477.1 sensor histidine kinase [Paenisporosarcina cavernae]